MRIALRNAVAFLLAAFLLGINARASALSPVPDWYTVLFASDSAQIDAAGRKVIDQVVARTVAKTQGRLDNFAISVTGHADRAGGAEGYNLALSLKRAEAVRDALVAAGIPASAITVARRGEEEPAAPTPDGVAEQANRRAEIIMQ
jgi:OOP family OmpA-OmpF porin